MTGIGRDGEAPGAAGLHRAGGAALLRPEEQTLAAMLDGLRDQQLARSLAFSTMGKRLTAIGADTRHGDAFPWAWTSQMVNGWLDDLRGLSGYVAPRSATTPWRFRRSTST